MIVKAELRYVHKIQEILQIFGDASGLRCIWEKTKAAYVPGGPPPIAFEPLPWTWEQNANASKLMGYPTASSLSTEQMEVQVHRRIPRALKRYPVATSLAGRIVAANSLIMGTIWYLLTLRAGDLAFLAKLQTLVDSFVWARKSRVNRNTTT